MKPCQCNDPSCPAGPVMTTIRALETDGDKWDIENLHGFTMATTAAVKNLPHIVQFLCCKMVDESMTEQQMRPLFERVLQGKDHYGNTVMHYFALRENDDALAALLRVGGCMCIHNKAGQSATDVRRTKELRMFDEDVPFAVCVFKPSDVPTMRIESIGATAPSALCEECDVA